jgi:hypothetical protein
MVGTSNQSAPEMASANLVGGFKHVLFSVSYMGCHPLSSFPLTNSIIFQGVIPAGDKLQRSAGFLSVGKNHRCGWENPWKSSQKLTFGQSINLNHHNSSA